MGHSHMNKCFKVVKGRLGECPTGEKKISHLSQELSSEAAQK